MPHKHNADRRHHIPKMTFKVRNWPEYEAGLRRRGSLTLWIEDAALEHWQTVGPAGQPRYKDAAIQTTLMVRTAFRLAFSPSYSPSLIQSRALGFVLIKQSKWSRVRPGGSAAFQS